MDRNTLTHQLVELVPRLDLVVRDVEGGEVAAHGQAVEGVDLVVGDPQLLQRAGHVFQLLDLQGGKDQTRGNMVVNNLLSNFKKTSTAMFTFLMRFLPSERIFSLLIPAREPMRSILFVERARRLGKGEETTLAIVGATSIIMGTSSYSQFFKLDNDPSIFAIGGIWQYNLM